MLQDLALDDQLGQCAEDVLDEVFGSTRCW